MKMRTHYVLFALFLCILTSCSTEPIEAETLFIAENVTQIEIELLEIVNNHRISLGATALLFSDVAYTYANTHNDYMIAQGNLSHDNFSSRASKISTKSNAEEVAENVAKDYDTANEVFQGWLKSPNHKTTMEGFFTHTAVSVKKDSNGNLYFVHLFYR